MSIAGQSSSWPPTEPVIAQAAEPELESRFQPDAAVPAGSGSLRITPTAVLGPPFSIVIENPIGSPALTEGLSAVFVRVSSVGKHVTLAEPCASGPLYSVAVAVLS